MKGTMFFPFKGYDSDYSRAEIKEGMEGQVTNGLRVDRVTKTEKGFEVDYTVVDPKLFDLLKPSRVECSIEPRREGKTNGFRRNHARN